MPKRGRLRWRGRHRLEAVLLSAIQAEVVSKGITLSLLVPQQAFPRDSLVRVTVQAKNMSSKPTELYPIPQASVLDGQGHSRYNASEGTYPPLPTHGPGGRPNG